MEYGLYSDILKLFRAPNSPNGVLDEIKILDPTFGLAARMMSLCDDKLREAADPKRDFDPPEIEVEILRFEKNTWDLVQQLYATRKTRPSPVLHPAQLLVANPYTPTDTLLANVLETDKPSSNTGALSELHLVLKWLEKTAVAPPPISTTTGYRRFSKTRVLHSKRTSNWGAWENMVRSLDPDSIYQTEDGLKKLAPEDEGSQQALLRAVFLYIRAGRTEEVRDLCRAAHEPWRGAVTRGRLVAGCPALDVHGEESSSKGTYQWTGNKRRRLFKNVCTRIALETTSPPLNRLFHAALAPSQSTLHVLVGGIAEGYCNTWEDLLWARTNVLFEERWETLLNKYEGTNNRKHFTDLDMEDAVEEGEEWEKDVGSVLESMESVEVQEGPDANDPFHVAQLYTILNRMDLLCRRIADNMGTISASVTLVEESVDYRAFARYLRFFAHLVLYSRYLNVPLPDEEADQILNLYLNLLEKTESSQILAQYCAELAYRSNERYAKHLTNLPLNVEPLQRIESLVTAGKYGLNVVEIAIRACEDTVQAAFEALPSTQDLFNSHLAPEDYSDRERYLIRSLEWVVNDPQTHECASRMASRTITYFMAIGKPGAAVDIHTYLPNDLFSEGVITDDLFKEEYTGWTIFVETWKAFNSFEDVAGNAIDMEAAPGERRSKWLKRYSENLDECWEKTIEVLTTDWPVEFDDQHPKADDYKRIRRIYIPHLTRRLHKTLLVSRRHVPRSHKRIFELVNIVADDRYGVVSELREGSVLGERTQLELYLGEVKNAVVTGLELGGSDPFYGIAKEDNNHGTRR